MYLQSFIDLTLILHSTYWIQVTVIKGTVRLGLKLNYFASQRFE